MILASSPSDSVDRAVFSGDGAEGEAGVAALAVSVRAVVGGGGGCVEGAVDGATVF